MIQEIKQEESIELKAEVVYVDGTTGSSVNWSTTSANVTLSKEGLLTGVKTGIAIITAEEEGVKDSITIEVKSNLNDKEKEFVYEEMHNNYLWRDEVPSLDYKRDDNETVYALLEELMYSPEKGGYDTWSFIMTEEEYHSTAQAGEFKGYGFYYYYNSDDKKANLLFVYKNSPMDNAGFKRGDSINTVNGKSITEFDAKTFSAEFSNDAITVNAIALKKENFNIETVLHKDIITTTDSEGKNIKVGYLVYESFFIEKGAYELLDAFKYFKDNEIDELILDLRYNGGGYTYIAEMLAGLITLKDKNANDLSEQIFYENRTVSKSEYSKFNLAGKIADGYINANIDGYNTVAEMTLNLDSLIVISTDGTASASELIVNGLAPYIDVTLVGGKTHGKPVGMNGRSFSDKILFAINFEALNSLGNGKYFDGLGVLKGESPETGVQNVLLISAEDSIDKNWQDFEEDSFATALKYIQTGIVPENVVKRSLRGKNMANENLKGFRRLLNIY